MWPKRFSYLAAQADDRGVILAEEECRVQLDSETIVTEARIVFRPHRFPSAAVELANVPGDVVDEKPVTLYFKHSGLLLENGHVSTTRHQAHHSRYRYRVLQAEPMTLQNGGNVIALDCLVYNLSRFAFQGGPSNGMEVLSLELPNGWRATIGPVPIELRQQLRVWDLLRTPWRRPTHNLSISCGDCEATTDELNATLFLLRNFLSFAWGRQIGLGLLQGFSKDGSLVYAAPGITTVDALTCPSARQPHWFPLSHAEILSEILPGFWSRMTDREWKDAVEWALYWWLSANHSGQVSETAILASQAGLEAVAPLVLQHFGALQSTKGSAVEKIREMMTIMQVPLSIPGQLDELRAVASTKNWDGPLTLTKVRNALTHPAKGQESGLAYEASQLGMWYLELVLLFLFGYKGKVFNRTVFGGAWFEVERVPWS